MYNIYLVEKRKKETEITEKLKKKQGDLAELQARRLRLRDQLGERFELCSRFSTTCFTVRRASARVEEWIAMKAENPDGIGNFHFIC